MKDLEQAKAMLTMAKKDCRALVFMSDSDKLAAEIFGFHVQQAMEKCLKAWLCCIGATFPKIHDLDELAALLEEAGQPLPEIFTNLLIIPTLRLPSAMTPFPNWMRKLTGNRLPLWWGN